MITNHVLAKGETPTSLALKFTGDSKKYTDLLPCNKGLKQVVDGQTGRPAFHTCDWKPGIRVNIPSSWTTEGTVGRIPVRDTFGRLGENPGEDTEGGQGSGTRVPETCSVSPLTEVKEYLYQWTGGDGMENGASGFAAHWFAQSDSGSPTAVDVQNFQRANYELVTVKKPWGCDFRNFPTGRCFKIPASWPNPKSGSKLLDKLRNSDCVTKYKGSTGSGTGGSGDDSKGTEGIDKVLFTGDDSTSTWLALLAVGGLAAVAGVYMYKQRNKR
jgi:LPXTG-motif cell wall-anchored protein